MPANMLGADKMLSPVCFRQTTTPVAAAPISPFLMDAKPTARHCEGLAALLPILGCGEEAATLAFDGLALAIDDDRAGCIVLASIARDEAQHDALIVSLRAALPPPPDQRETLKKARRFHIDLGRGTIALRLARIAALDSAVCIVLGKLLGRRSVLSGAPAIHRALSSLWQDEARHVAISRQLALARENGATLRPMASEAREALAEILQLGGAALEALEVDTDRLAREVRQLPKRLFA
jgi:hypothetical protein